MRRNNSRGFTLVELLVVIGIIAVLIGILLPTLGRARESANTVKCASNMRSIGQGFALYSAGNKGFVPAAYENTGWQINGGVQTPTNGVAGYTHWSYYIFGTGAVGAEAFQCPSMTTGGLPPTSPKPGNWEQNTAWETINVGGAPYPTVSGVDGYGTNIPAYAPDLQVQKTAYTVNEAVMGRNKHEAPLAIARKYATAMQIGKVKNNATTILATEFIDNKGLVSGTTGGNGGPNVIVKSHRPVSGWRSSGGTNCTTSLDMQKVLTTDAIRRTDLTDLEVDPLKSTFSSHDTSGTSKTRLDWVGSNHGRARLYRDKLTNFLYVDGHVETKSLKLTIPVDNTTTTPWEWGDQHYTLIPNN